MVGWLKILLQVPRITWRPSIILSPNKNFMPIVIQESDVHTQELIDYYKKRLGELIQFPIQLETGEIEYQAALDAIDSIKISHQETHKLSWEVLKRTKEVNQLQHALGDFQAAVFEERKHTLKIVAENDVLKGWNYQ